MIISNNALWVLILIGSIPLLIFIYIYFNRLNKKYNMKHIGLRKTIQIEKTDKYSKSSRNDEKIGLIIYNKISNFFFLSLEFLKGLILDIIALVIQTLYYIFFD